MIFSELLYIINIIETNIIFFDMSLFYAHYFIDRIIVNLQVEKICLFLHKILHNFYALKDSY